MYTICDLVYIGVGFLGICATIGVSVGIPLSFKYRTQKMMEEYRANNLMLAYQLMQERPEITIQEVKNLLEYSKETSEAVER